MCTMLAGTLNVVLANSFTPASGGIFQIMTYGSFTGVFDTITGLALSNGLNLSPTYNETALTLTAM